MSHRFFEFTIKCPKCGHIHLNADGFETDDWVEVFVFSGLSEKNARNNYKPYYKCPSCCEKTDIDSLYSGHFIKTECVDKVVNYLENQLPMVVELGRIYDHGWEPDLDMVLHRYSCLYPTDQRLEKLKKLYYYAVHDPRFFTKFEPANGTEIVRADMIPYRQLLKKVYLPNTVTQIGEDTFIKTGIADIFLPRNIIIIGNRAFKDCYNLTSVHSPDALAKIGEYAFYNTRISKFFFPEKIKEIGAHAFEKTSLTEVYIPSGCMNIGDEAFANCFDLKKIFISKEYEHIARLFEPTAELHYLEGPYKDGIDRKQCKFRVDYSSFYEGSYAKKEYDILFNFVSLDSMKKLPSDGSLNSAMKYSCLSICDELVKDTRYPIGEFRLMDKHRVMITNQLVVVKVPNFKEWKMERNIEIIKEIYERLLKYAYDNNFQKLAFPLWAQDWNFHYYSELLLHIKQMIKKNNYSFESISWFGCHKDFFYDFNSSDSMKRELKKIFHMIEVERV